MAKYYKATEDSFFEKSPLNRSDMADMMIAAARMLNLMQRSKDICSVKELREALCEKYYPFEMIQQIQHTSVVYDDTKELGLGADGIETYPIICDGIYDVGDYDIIAYYDRISTGINADIMVCVQKYEAEENGKIKRHCDKWIQIDFPDNRNSIVISDGKIQVT